MEPTLDELNAQIAAMEHTVSEAKIRSQKSMADFLAKLDDFQTEQADSTQRMREKLSAHYFLINGAVASLKQIEQINANCRLAEPGPLPTLRELVVLHVGLGVSIALICVYLCWLVNLIREIFVHKKLVHLVASIVWGYYSCGSIVRHWIDLNTPNEISSLPLQLLARMLYHQVIDWAYAKARNRLCPVRKNKRT